MVDNTRISSRNGDRRQIMMITGGMVLIMLISCSEAFQNLVLPRSYIPSTTTTTTTQREPTTVLHMAGKIQKAKQQQKKQQKFNLQKVLDDLDDEDDEEDGNVRDDNSTDAKMKRQKMSVMADAQPDDEGNAMAEEMRARMDNRPTITEQSIDDGMGMMVVKQGRYVMDVIRRKPIFVDKDPAKRLEQMFPEPSPEIRAKHRLDWNTVEFPEIRDKLRAACEINGTLPVHPSVSHEGVEFVLANYDILGWRAQQTFSGLGLAAAYRGELKEMNATKALNINFRTIDNYIAAPFRQCIMDSELNVGPNFGNMNIASFAGTELWERAATYIVLKGMQCHWEKRLRDAEKLSTMILTRKNRFIYTKTGDPRRYAEDKAIYTVEDCSRVCTVAVKMAKEFVQNPALYDDLPVELRFLEEALSIKGGAALRNYVVKEFCPRENITPEALREKMARLTQQLHSMYKDPYLEIYMVLNKLLTAIRKETPEDRTPYAPYSMGWKKGTPGYFETYTWNVVPQSLSFSMASDRYQMPPENFPNRNPSFSEYVEQFKASPKKALKKRWKQFLRDWELDDDLVISRNPFDGEIALINRDIDPDQADYYPPEKLARGRPHNLTWWYDLNPIIKDPPPIQDMTPGEIIME